MKVKYVGKLEDLKLTYGSTYDVVEGPDRMGNVTILDEKGYHLWLLSTEIEIICDGLVT